MYIYVLDNELNRIGLIDNFVSLIWTTRYYSYGDFELYVPINNELIEILQIGRYLQTTESDTVMIIEGVHMMTSAENGNYMTVSGRSVESLLTRRVLTYRTYLNGPLELCLINFVKNNFVDPLYGDARKIDCMATAEPKGFTQTLDGQYFGNNVYELISQNCISNSLGFKMPFVNGKFTFEIYEGKNRTRSQQENEPAVFSPQFENIVNTEYTYDTTERKNVAFVAGDGEGNARKTTLVNDGIEGLYRYEMYVDARDISSVDENEHPIPTTQYLNMLSQRGKEKLSETITHPEYVGEVNNFPEYCELGDIVEVENEFGMVAKARVIEIIESYSVSGNTRIPTFDEWSV